LEIEHSILDIFSSGHGGKAEEGATACPLPPPRGRARERGRITGYRVWQYTRQPSEPLREPEGWRPATWPMAYRIQSWWAMTCPTLIFIPAVNLTIHQLSMHPTRHSANGPWPNFLLFDHIRFPDSARRIAWVEESSSPHGLRGIDGRSLYEVCNNEIP